MKIFLCILINDSRKCKSVQDREKRNQEEQVGGGMTASLVFFLSNQITKNVYLTLKKTFSFMNFVTKKLLSVINLYTTLIIPT